MVAKKAGTAVAVRKSDAVALPTDWEQQLAQYAQQSKKTEESVSMGSWLTFKGGQMKFKGENIKDNEVEAVVLDAVMENTFYEGKYDLNNVTSPVCFAFAREEEQLAPHTTATKPQHQQCRGCPQNQFGTADNGRGKACKNSRRLALISFGDGSPEHLQVADITFAKLPVTSVKNFAGFVTRVTERFKRPPLAFKVLISVSPDSKNQFTVNFTDEEALDKPQIAALLARAKEAQGVIIPVNPYPPREEEEKPAARGKARAGKAKY